MERAIRRVLIVNYSGSNNLIVCYGNFITFISLNENMMGDDHNIHISVNIESQYSRLELERNVNFKTMHIVKTMLISKHTTNKLNKFKLVAYY